MSGLEAQERWARVAWSFLVEPRNARAVAALAAHGGVGALERLRSGTLGGGELTVRLDRLDLDDLAHAVDRAGVSVLVPGDPQWPSGVDRLDDPPYCLYVRGDAALADLTERSVAVVGSRAATEYGLRAAADLGDGLAVRGWTVVSGAAYGIDGAAHRGALAARGRTVAVLACGVDRAYPSAHAELLGAIATSGAVVSEVPLGCAPFRHRFLARNRIIAALTRTVVVVEAGHRSGSLSTAAEARRCVVPVAAVPGPVTSMTSAGSHNLIRDTGAVLVTDAAEVAELAARIGEDLLPLPEPGPRCAVDDLDPQGYALYSSLPASTPVGVEHLAATAGVDPRGLAVMLAALEADGLAERVEGRWRRARRPG